MSRLLKLVRTPAREGMPVGCVTCDTVWRLIETDRRNVAEDIEGRSIVIPSPSVARSTILRW